MGDVEACRTSEIGQGKVLQGEGLKTFSRQSKMTVEVAATCEKIAQLLY